MKTAGPGNGFATYDDDTFGAMGISEDLQAETLVNDESQLGVTYALLVFFLSDFPPLLVSGVAWTNKLACRPDDIIIAVMGITGSGKTTFISHFTDNAEIGHNLTSCKLVPSTLSQR